MQRLVRNLILPCLLCTPVIANAVSWTEAIASVQNDADQYHDYAVEVGGTSWAGSMYNGYKYDEHRCAILGRMLGLHSFIHHIEEFDYPPMDTRSDPHDLLVFAISLRNWVGAARWAVAAHDTERKSVWNLDCVGHFGIAKSAYVENAAPNAEFEIRGAQLHVYGDIEAGFAKRFIETLNSHPEIEEIALGSAGGSVADAIFAGLAIRHRGLSTTIYGNCYSACPLVFLGGVQRVVWAAPHRLGFHQIYKGVGIPLPLDDDYYIAVAGYVDRMGADADLLLMWMHSATPGEMYEPPVDDLCRARVATFVQRRCSIRTPP